MRWAYKIVVTSLTCLLSFALPLHAQEWTKPESVISCRSDIQTFSDAAGLINQTDHHLLNNDFQTKIEEIKTYLQVDGLSCLEVSTLYQMLGSLHYEVNRYDLAISAFENAIKAGGLKRIDADKLRLNIAQLLIASGRNVEGATLLEVYIEQGHPVKPAYVDMLVSAWVQAEEYDRALPWAQRWFDEANPKQRKHFDLLNFLYNNLGMKDKQADIVVQMIERSPEDTSLWHTWAIILANSGREHEAFNVHKMLYLNGALSDEKNLITLVQYYNFYDMPYQAASILEREINAGHVAKTASNFIRLSDYYARAREPEKSVAAYAMAAENGDGNMKARYSERLYNAGHCEEADAMAEKAKRQGGTFKGSLWSYRGTCYYDAAGKIETQCMTSPAAGAPDHPKVILQNKAIAAFAKAPKKSSQYSDSQKWISFIQAEIQAVQNKCKYVPNPHKELCFQDIKGAYANMAFNGGKFELSDPVKCQKHIEKYDTIYRIETDN